MDAFDPRRDLGSDLSAGAARLDRLRARPVTPAPRPPRAVLPWLLTAVLLAFALGLIANPWFERSVRSSLPGFAPTLAPSFADLDAVADRVAALETRAVRPVAANPGVTAVAPVAGERLVRAETELAGLAAAVPAATARTDQIAADLATLTGRFDAGAAATAAALASATANAERAQAMLVLAAARRQIDAGARLGALEPAMRRAFPQSPPVEAVAALGAAPVTLAALRSGLDQLRAAAGDAPAAGAPRSWWDGFRATFAGIVQPAVPAGDATGAGSRYDRAARALAEGNAAAAIAEVAALPAAGRRRAAPWLAAAERHQAGLRGLAALEATMLEPLPPAPVLPIAPAPSRSAG